MGTILISGQNCATSIKMTRDSLECIHRMSKKNTITLIIAVTVFLVFISLTSPYHLPLLLLVVPGIAFIVALNVVLRVALSKLHLKPSMLRMMVAVLTTIVSVVAVLMSVGQLTFKDFSLLLALALLGIFYISRMKDA